MKCSYCDETAVSSIMRPVGDAPANPKHHGTQADERKQEVVNFCAAHWTRLVTFLDLAMRLP